MLRNTATVGFIMSHACPLKCDFCCHDRQTVGPGRVSRAAMLDVMARFGLEPSVVRFAFSGGEPFLYYDDIVAALADARLAGVAQPFSIVTSAHWAGGRRTRDWLARLCALGMDRIDISYDTEHARWVTPGQVREVGLAARELGARVEVHANFWDRAERVQELLPDVEQWADQVYTRWVVRAGRAARSGRRANHHVPEQAKYSCGQPAHYAISVFPDGEAYPCCSGDFNQSAKLSCGNVNKDSAGEILATAYANFHVRMVKEFGWGVLFDVVRRDFPELASRLPDFADADGPCEVCRDLNTRLKEELRPVYARIEAQYLSVMGGAAGLEADEAARRAFYAGRGVRP